MPSEWCLCSSASHCPRWKKGQKTESRHFSVAVRMSHSPLSQFGFLKQFSKEQRLFFYLTDLRISGFGDHGPQLLYAVINVESSSPLNCRQAGMTCKKKQTKKKHWVCQMAFESLRRPNNNASNKSDRGDKLDLLRELVTVQSDLLRLWLSFFCLSFSKALASVSERQCSFLNKNINCIFCLIITGREINILLYL